MRYFNIAGIITAISDKNSCGRALADYFSSSECREIPSKVDFEIRVCDDVKEAAISEQYTAVSGKIRFNRNEFSVKEKYYTYTVRNLFSPDETPELLIAWTRKGNLYNALRDRVSIKTIGTSGEEKKFLETILNYKLFWYVFALVLERHGKIFVHSAIFALKGKAFVLAGSAGCGKTSTLLRVLENRGNSYIDEDFGVIGADGLAYYVPKRVTVYEDDAAYGSPIIKKALGTMSASEKNAWKLFGAAGINMRYKFRPEVIFPGQVAEKAEIGEIVFVSRSSCTQPDKRTVDHKILAEKILCASWRELKVLYEILNNIRAVGDEEILKAYPSVRELEEKYRTILEEILEKCPKTSFVRVPQKAGPDVTCGCLFGKDA